MADKTKIEWSDATWNCVTGCTKVSPGCDHCYAETFAERWRGTPGHHFEQGFDIRLWPDRLTLPLHWTRPRKIFVNSMSDVFHEDVPESFIAEMFAVMAGAPQHAFQVLTKRHGRMRSLLSNEDFWLDVFMIAENQFAGSARMWPLPNVWLGVSVEDQKWADIRVPALLDTPAAVRFLSCEPLLGPVDLPFTVEVGGCNCAGGTPESAYMHEQHCGLEPGIAWDALHWVIAGGESGPGARPMDEAWARSLRDQCQFASVPFFFKQWGGRTPKAGGRLLDGREWSQFPAAAEAVTAGA